MAHGRKTVDKEMADLFNHFENKDGHSTIVSLDQPWFYKVWDTNQKFLSLQNGSLLAVPQNTNSDGQLLAVTPNEAIDASKRPIFMGTKSEKYILKVTSGGKPELQLAAGDIMELYKKKEESKEFTFYSQTKGSETTASFESAAHPGWFLSTSSEANKPLHMSQEGGSDITLFYIEKK